MRKLTAARLGAVALGLCAVLAAPSAGLAASVENGNFETGNLQGWQVHRVTELGDWYAYRGTDAPIGGKQLGAPVIAPPQGTYAAITDEYNPDTVVLYQDIVLRAGYEHRLNMQPVPRYLRSLLGC